MPNKEPQVEDSAKPAATVKDDPVIKREFRRTWIKIFAALISFVAIAVYLAWDLTTGGPLYRFWNSREQIIESVRANPVLASIVYILLQIIQTVAAPIPGQVVGGVGGFLFGPWGILWTTIGTLVGCYIVFRIARNFGRPLLEKLFQKATIDKFDFIINNKHASLILFLIFLLPGFPDDVICYIAGLTKLPIRQLMTIVILGRLPVIVLTNYLGEGLNSNIELVAIISVVAVILLSIGIWQRERILNWMKRKK